MSLVVSAPGKVLIAGGYLVLDPKYSGVVVSTSSRFYTIIRESGRGSLVQVRSPQFISAEWEARIHVLEDGRISLENVDSAKALSKNKFVFLALQKVLQLIGEMKGRVVLEEKLQSGLDITIVGDNDFYSQRAQLKALDLPSTIESLKKIPPFVSANVTLGDVHKTGLGSSAALITSLVTALLVHFSVVSPPSLATENDEGRTLCHNVAQYVHCLAQGKVGSGFDVSAAIFGSHIYKRFDPAVIAPLMNDTESITSLQSVLSPSNHSWNHVIWPFRLPPGLRLMLADVDAGSDTPSLVGKVLKWRGENPADANALWDSLSARNQELASILTALVELHASDAEAYNSSLAQAALQPYSKWATLQDDHSGAVGKLEQTRAVAEDIREYMRRMGTGSGTPIEPPEQSRLLDACLAEAGVVAGGVPGAGGYDAIWLLVIESQPGTEPSPVTLVQNVWSSWTELGVSSLSAMESQERGVRIENIDAVAGLKNVLRS